MFVCVSCRSKCGCTLCVDSIKDCFVYSSSPLFLPAQFVTSALLCDKNEGEKKVFVVGLYKQIINIGYCPVVISLPNKSKE